MSFNPLADPELSALITDALASKDSLRRTIARAIISDASRALDDFTTKELGAGTNEGELAHALALIYTHAASRLFFLTKPGKEHVVASVFSELVHRELKVLATNLVDYRASKEHSR